jgi:di/tricarboxylate transporter
MVLIGRHLLPDRKVDQDEELVREYQLRDYLTEVKVLPDSPLIGLSLVETRLGEEQGLNIVGIVRDNRLRVGIMRDEKIQSDDLLLQDLWTRFCRPKNRWGWPLIPISIWQISTLSLPSILSARSWSARRPTLSARRWNRSIFANVLT